MHRPCLRICCRYLPLELLNADFRWLDKADMFALGATLFELSSRSELPTGGQLYQDLRHGKVRLCRPCTPICKDAPALELSDHHQQH
jgi:hypothetical protein